MDKDNTRAQVNSAEMGEGAAVEMDYIADLVADDTSTTVESSALAQDDVVFLGEPDPKPLMFSWPRVILLMNYRLTAAILH